MNELTVVEAQSTQSDDADSVPGVINLRDTSATTGGTMGLLFRSGTLHRADPAGSDLSGVSIRTVVDLREVTEAAAAPDTLPSGTQLLSRPIYGGDIPRTIPLEQVYRLLLTECGPALAGAVSTVVEHLHDGVLVHCTAGKDRTGMVIALLLAAVGADRQSIIADYSMSSRMLSPAYRQLTTERLSESVSDPVDLDVALRLHLESPASAMDLVLDWLDTEYDGARAYLVAHGVAASELDRAGELLFPGQATP